MVLNGSLSGGVAGSLQIEGDGDKIEITPVLTSGEKIATFTINEGGEDEQVIDLYTPEGFSGSWNDLTDKPTLFSGVYSDLSSKPTLNGDTINGNMYTSVYTTNEVRIGTWLDGKPLYKRTWNFISPIIIGANSWADSDILVSDTYIYNIIDCDVVSDNGAKWGFISATTDLATTTYVRLLNVRNTAVYAKYLTLVYTKTTDYEI